MIHLCSVTKSVESFANGPSLMLRNANASIHLNSRVALMGRNPAHLTTLLHLLAGSEKPDRGEIVSDRFRRSPVINCGPTGGNCLLNRLTAIENIEFFAEMNGLDPLHLIAMVEASCQFGNLLRQPVVKFDPLQRRALEVALVSSVPYDCYFVDKMDTLKRKLIVQLFRAARENQAGVIFTANKASEVAEFAWMGVVVRDGSIQVFHRFKMAILAHERH